jgi:hypothetical protein
MAWTQLWTRSLLFYKCQGISSLFWTPDKNVLVEAQGSPVSGCYTSSADCGSVRLADNAGLFRGIVADHKAYSEQLLWLIGLWTQINSQLCHDPFPFSFRNLGEQIGNQILLPALTENHAVDCQRAAQSG